MELRKIDQIIFLEKPCYKQNEIIHANSSSANNSKNNSN